MVADHQFHPLRVSRIVEETSDSRTFVLDVPDHLSEVFDYSSGQFCTFRATIAGSEVARCYSMSSSPALEEPLSITVKRVPGGAMSNWMIDTLAAGDSIDVLRPAGLFVLQDNDRPLVAFAGGSGITPIMSIIKTALVLSGRQIRLIYANKSVDSVIFAKELGQLGASHGERLDVIEHLDDSSGFLDAVTCASFANELRNADFYICGPGPFMDVVESALGSLGVEEERVFIERFASLGDDADVASETESVTFKHQRRKKSGEYRDGDTLLESARRLGVSPPFSCEGGSCGTCMALVEEGSATMRVNNALTPDEVDGGWVLTCQAIPTSREVVVNYDA